MLVAFRPFAASRREITKIVGGGNRCKARINSTGEVGVLRQQSDYPELPEQVFHGLGCYYW